MGIPFYFTHIIRRHPDIFIQCNNSPDIKSSTDDPSSEPPTVFRIGREVHQLAFDCNSIIYDIVRKLQDDRNGGNEPLDECAIIAGVIAQIDEYVGMFQPTVRVLIAFDGVAPMAKLEQQRQRRYKSFFEKTYFHRYSSQTGLGGAEAEREIWNTAAITPGTEFMQRLSRDISAYYACRGVSGLEYVVSTSEEEGEGEHKLFSFLRDQVADNAANGELTTLVYGLDADLFMLALNHLVYHPSLFLYRETPSYIQSLQKDLDPDANYVLDIYKLMLHLRKEMVSGSATNAATTDATESRDEEAVAVRYMRDYVFMCFLLGNDFLPHFPAVNIRTRGMEKLLEGYRETFADALLPSTTTFSDESADDDVVSHFVVWNCKSAKTYIRWSNVLLWLENLARREEGWWRRENAQRQRAETQSAEMALDTLPETVPMETRVRALNIVPMTSRELEKYIADGMAVHAGGMDWKQRYYDKLLDISIQNDRTFRQRQKLCDNYLQGLEWTLFYYTHGCVDFEWKYKYNYPPLLTDLRDGLQNQLLQLSQKDCGGGGGGIGVRGGGAMHVVADGWRFGWKLHTKCVSPLTQLAYVLPRESLEKLLVPVALRKRLLSAYPQWYPATGSCCFVWSYCKYFWEAHAILPEIPIQTLQHVLDSFPKTAHICKLGLNG